MPLTRKLIAEHLACLAERAGATPIATACTEDEAVQSVHERTPDFIFSDVSLLAGTGPHAVRTIGFAIGTIPAIFNITTLESCEPATRRRHPE